MMNIIAGATKLHETSPGDRGCVRLRGAVIVAISPSSAATYKDRRLLTSTRPLLFPEGSWLLQNYSNRFKLEKNSRKLKPMTVAPPRSMERRVGEAGGLR